MSLLDFPYRLLAKMVTSDPEAFIALGNAETRLLKKRLPVVTSPVYICGLARAGTTILTKAIATHPDVATHTYRDFPCLFTPYYWNKMLSAFDWVPFRAKPHERAHKDGMMVTPKSPEAMEEMLWMAFFKQLHDETRSAILDAKTSNEAFAAFYREHIQKLLLAHNKTRYASKANYNLTRIPYILSLFPDARFVIAVRQPLPHVWSLYQKDKLFRAEQEKTPASLTHMQQAGHFEFGKGRTLIHTGDDAAMASVRACFANGEDLRGWARYWAMLQRFIAQECTPRPEVLIVRHEDICAHKETMAQIADHCRLKYSDTKLAAAAGIFRETTPPAIPKDMEVIIREETEGVSA